MKKEFERKEEAEIAVRHIQQRIYDAAPIEKKERIYLSGLCDQLKVELIHLELTETETETETEKQK